MVQEILKRVSGETEDQCIWRIGQAKANGLLGDITWPEIADFLNKEFREDETSYYDSSAYRKKYKNFADAYEGIFCKENFADEQAKECLKQIQEATDKMYKAKRQFQDQRREYNKILTADARSEHLISALTKAAENLNETKMLGRYGYPINVSDNEAVLVCCDWHYGAVTENIWNTYNTQVCKDRVNTLCEKAKNYLSLNRVNTLHILLLGDFIHGALRASVRVASEENTCEQLMNVSELLAEFIDEVSSKVNIVKVYSTYGNHARTIQNKEDSIHSDNMERIIPFWLRQRFKSNNKIEIVDSEFYEFIRCNVCGHDIIATHGDLERFNKFGVDMHTLFSKKYGIDVEYTFSGDKHHSESNDSYGIDNVLVSSLCGTDNYANGKRLYSKAGQTLCIFNKEDGKICSYNITF